MNTTKTLTELQKEFMADLRKQGRSSSTILAYNKDIEQLTAFLAKNGKIFPLEIKPSDIEAFRNSLGKDKYTDKSVSRKLNAIKSFSRYLVSQKILEQDPAAPVAHPKFVNPAPRILTRMEYRALRDAAREDYRIAAIIELMLQTGIRIGEVANLQLEDIKDDKMTVRAYESQPERSVPLNPPAKQALSGYIKIRPQAKAGHIFITKTGRPLLVRNIRNSIDRYFKEAGIENAKVNDLRNTFIAHQLKTGVDLVTVSRVVGHKRLSTTERYLELVERKEAGKGNRLEEL
ncbi:MAG: tyrosine-type recombinase/integrase [Candidatus Blackburnbacteria bacterium]|nr:tyrosine-type recombinase/integrase [Candidatus Blackburnbacteria bacterium]